jgi:uncharacterized membrane protein
MTSLILAAVFFVAIHLLVAATALRDRLIARLGAGAYRGMFSLASVVGIVWLGVAYAGAPLVPLWGQFPGCKIVALAGMLIAVVLVVVGLTTPNPTSVGGEALLARAAAPVGILRITRHPFLWGVALWALVHLVVNGDLASLVLFGGLLGLALIGPASIDRKRRRALGAAWDGFAGRTSNLPFLAIAEGRTGLGLGEIKPWQWLAALAAFALTVALHQAVFGVSPLPG